MIATAVGRQAVKADTAPETAAPETMGFGPGLAERFAALQDAGRLLNVHGVVESVSLRSLKLRSITGEVLHVPNSGVNALRVIPRGYREVELEFFTSELEAGQALVEQIARVVPFGPTHFIRRPSLVESDRLDDDLFRITARCAVAAGREWLATEFLPSLLKERAAEGLLVHGPIISYVDEEAAHSFARALGRPPTPG